MNIKKIFYVLGLFSSSVLPQDLHKTNVDPFQNYPIDKPRQYDDIGIKQSNIPEDEESEMKQRFEVAKKDNLILHSSIKLEDSLLIHIYGVWNKKRVNISMVVDKAGELKAASSDQFLMKFDLKNNENILEGSFFLYDVVTGRRISSGISAKLEKNNPVLLGYFPFKDDHIMNDYILVWVLR